MEMTATHDILSFSLVQESALSVVDAIIAPEPNKERNIYSCFISFIRLCLLKVTFLMRGLAKILYLFGTDKESVK